jgi:hypothetical protein
MGFNKILKESHGGRYCFLTSKIGHVPVTILEGQGPQAVLSFPNLSDYLAGNFHGPALTLEYNDVDWNGNAVIAQDTPQGTYHWVNGNAQFYAYK